MHFLRLSTAIAVSTAIMTTAIPYQPAHNHHARDLSGPDSAKIEYEANPTKTEFEAKVGTVEYEWEAKPTEFEKEYENGDFEVEYKSKPTGDVIEIESGTFSTELHATPAPTGTLTGFGTDLATESLTHATTTTSLPLL